jgi:hypothetical protein
MDSLLAIFIILVTGWYWLDSLRARELALGICRVACAERDIQFLDQTVALRRLRLRWTTDGLRLRRTYRFEFSEEGSGRQGGYLTLVGLALEEISFGLPGQTWDA